MIAAAFAVAAAVMTGCQEEKESPTRMSLAVNDTTMNISAKAGSEHVLVYAKSRWTASLEEAADWISLDKTEGDGNGEFIVKFNDNDGLMRRSRILITASGVDKTITFTVNQEGSLGNPELKFDVTEKSYIAWSLSDSLSFKANVPEDEISAVASEDWITDMKISDGHLYFTVGENTTGAERSAAVSLTYTDIDDNIYRTVATIVQTAQEGHIDLQETEMTVEAYEAVKTVSWSCVLGTFMPSLKLSVEYQGSQTGWISDLEATENNLSFKVAENPVKAERKAVVKAELAERNVAVTLTVTQMLPSKQYSFAELRALLKSAGEYKFDGDWFEAVVIADGGEKNMETNPMNSAQAFDDNESAITNYVQSADGKYGFRIKLDAASSNTFKKGEKVKISLAGASLIREDNPARYTLTGLGANSFASEGTAQLTPHLKTVAELSDDDIYTWTTLKNVELSFCYGSWSNVRATWLDASAGATQNMDYRILRDASGSSIDMLVNSNTSWLMTGNGVPRGSGNVSGVIVSTTSTYHEGMLGRYQIRPISLSDIEIKETGFSEILVDWFYPTAVTADATKKNVVNASTGTGTMECDVTKVTQTASYLNFEGKSENTKAIRYDGVWWKGGAAGNSVKWNFSTKAAAGKKLSFIFAAAMGKLSEDATGQTPVNWNIDWSPDGVNFTHITKVFIRPLPKKNTSLTCLPAALDEFCIDLPAAAAGQDNVTIRLSAADDTTIDFSTGEYTAKVTSTGVQYMRFGAVSVKYVK